MLAAGLLVVHDAERGRQDDVSKLLEKRGSGARKHAGGGGGAQSGIAVS